MFHIYILCNIFQLFISHCYFVNLYFCIYIYVWIFLEINYLLTYFKYHVTTNDVFVFISVTHWAYWRKTDNTGACLGSGTTNDSNKTKLKLKDCGTDVERFRFLRDGTIRITNPPGRGVYFIIQNTLQYAKTAVILHEIDGKWSNCTINQILYIRHPIKSNIRYLTTKKSNIRYLTPKKKISDIKVPPISIIPRITPIVLNILKHPGSIPNHHNSPRSCHRLRGQGSPKFRHAWCHYGSARMPPD